MQKLELYGDDDLSGELAIKKLLPVVHDKYTRVTLTVETLLDLSEPTIEKVMGRL